MRTKEDQSIEMRGGWCALLVLCVLLGACSATSPASSELEFVESEGRNGLSDVGGAVSPQDTSQNAPDEDDTGPALRDTGSLPDAAGEDVPSLADVSPSADAAQGDIAETGTPEDVVVPRDQSGADDTDGTPEEVSSAADVEENDADVEGPSKDAGDEAVDVDEPEMDALDPDQDAETPESDADAVDTSDSASEVDADEPECLEDADCPLSELACQVARCVAGSCGQELAEVGTSCEAGVLGVASDCLIGICDDLGDCTASVLEGAQCDDGNPCTSGESCDASGQCVGGGLTLCPPLGACELSLCDPSQGCVPVAVSDGLLCDDGDPCTVQTACEGGTCGGGENLCSCLEDADCYEDGDVCNGTPVCVDLPTGGKGCQIDPATITTCAEPDNPCLASLCQPADGLCVETVLPGASCDDGDPCTEGDICDDSAGCAGVPLACDDGVPCTDNLCSAGVCVFPSLDGAPCDDGDPCTVLDLCESAACVGEPKVCDDANPCTADQCVPSTGACLNSVDDGVLCDDGSLCTEGDVCALGSCTGTVISCDDDSLCTDDSCDPLTGCLNVHNSAPCPDGDLCTGPDVCEGGACVLDPVTCDDGLACTVDLCDPESGCTHTPDASTCDDDNPCTTDICVPSAGCLHLPNVASCDDGSLCTFDDLCAAGVCAGTPVLCNDGVDCTLDGCDLETGACVSSADDTQCDDGSPCTLTGCDLELGCVAVNDDGALCDDGVICTEGDTCAAGICVSGENICPCDVDSDCDDDDLCNGVYLCEVQPEGLTECVASVAPVLCDPALEAPCLVNLCDPLSGVCALTPRPDGTLCKDKDACTEKESCSGGTCQVSAVPCDDGVACTFDACDATSGCVHTPSSAACDDGLDCTDDSCLATTGCVHVPDDDECADDVACTVDTCDAESGCSLVEQSTLCDDGVACTLDICSFETGCSSLVDDALCDDLNPCTLDTCTPQGCVFEEAEGACEDGNPCTIDDLCEAGECVSGVPLECDDGDLCTKDICSPLTGQCVQTPQADGVSCEDGSACTELDRCLAGVCQSGPEASCDDAVPCTLDTCDPTSGCTYSGDDAACDDANPCTVDECVPGQGCVHTPAANFSPCDDGIAGTAVDLCVSGLCRGVQEATVAVPTLWCTIESARLARVSALDGALYALMNYKLSGILCGTVPCADGGGYCHSRVLRLDGVSTNSIATLGGTLTGLGHDAVVGSAGQVGQVALNGATVLWSWSDLASAVSSAGLAGGTWSDVWGAPYADGAGATYTLVGRTNASGSGRIVTCRDNGAGLGCELTLVDLGNWGWDTLTAVAAEGLSTGEGTRALALAQSTEPEVPSGLWLEDASGAFAFSPLASGLTVHGAMRQTEDSAWLVGDDALLARLDGNDWSTLTISGLDPEVTLSLRALTHFAGSILAVGHGDGGQGWLVTLALNADGTDAGAWRVISLGQGRRVHDIHASDQGVTIVGSTLDADGSTRPNLWHLSL